MIALNERSTTRYTKGFTLIELVVVVAIVGILASVAFNVYSSQIQKSNRVDAKDALTRAAVIQERRFFQNNAYIINNAELERLGIVDDVSLDGHYGITVATRDNCNGDNPEDCFIITATAVNGGQQFGDLQCRTFTIDDTQRRTATSSTGVDTTALCW